MKLTETFTPEQCREAMELLGGIIEWDVRGLDLRYALWTDPDWEFQLGNAEWTDQKAYPLGQEPAACIIQVAAEQVVREDARRRGCVLIPTHGHYSSVSADGGWVVMGTVYPTYLAALLAALRAVAKESKDATD